jgi:hypothetical protein
VRQMRTDEQKRALSDRDGHAALHILRHLLGGRAVTAQGKLLTRSPNRGMFCAVAGKLGRSVGRKRLAPEVDGRLRESGVRARGLAEGEDVRLDARIEE